MKKHLTFLSLLNQHAKNKKKRNAILKKASHSQINSIRNICTNICNKNLKIEKNTQKLLYRYKKDIRDLSNKKKLKTLNGVKKRLVHSGGFLPLILPPILSLLSTVGGRALAKAVGV